MKSQNESQLSPTNIPAGLGLRRFGLIWEQGSLEFGIFKIFKIFFPLWKTIVCIESKLQNIYKRLARRRTRINVSLSLKSSKILKVSQDNRKIAWNILKLWRNIQIFHLVMSNFIRSYVKNAEIHIEYHNFHSKIDKCCVKCTV